MNYGPGVIRTTWKEFVRPRFFPTFHGFGLSEVAIKVRRPFELACLSRASQLLRPIRAIFRRRASGILTFMFFRFRRD